MSDYKNIISGKRVVSLNALYFEASSLRSDGENPEYDRALVELTGFLSGHQAGELESVAKELGIKWSDPY